MDVFKLDIDYTEKPKKQRELEFPIYNGSGINPTILPSYNSLLNRYQPIEQGNFVAGSGVCIFPPLDLDNLPIGT